LKKKTLQASKLDPGEEITASTTWMPGNKELRKKNEEVEALEHDAPMGQASNVMGPRMELEKKKDKLDRKIAEKPPPICH